MNKIRYKVYVDKSFNKIKNIVPQIPIHVLRKRLRDGSAELEMSHLSKDEQILVLLGFIKSNELDGKVAGVEFLNQIIRNGGFTRSCYGYKNKKSL